MAFRRRAPKAPPDPIAAEVDPATVPAAYRPPVIDALNARSQFKVLVEAVPDGPMRSRLEELSLRVDAGVLAVWQTVGQAVRLEGVVAALDPDRVANAMKQAKRDEAAGTLDAATMEAVAARFGATQRLLNSLDDLRERLPVLEARLGTAVARAAELTLTSSASSSAAGLDALTGELDTLVLELDALRAGVDAVGGLGPA
jgi:hypothetical protein